MDAPLLSVVIPVHNEEKTLLPLYDRLVAVLDRLGRPFEILFVDDCSSDTSRQLLGNLVEHDDRLQVVLLRRNFGQTAALAAGFALAEGEIVVAMPAVLI